MNMGKSVIDFNEKKGFICDMDGVIYHGNQILPGVPEFIQWLHDEKKEYLFLTNNSGYTPRELNQKLARMGLDVPEEHFYTSALATAAFLKEQAAGCSAFVIGEAGLLNALYDVGITMNDVNPDYVVVGEGRSYSLDTLTKATNLVLKGAKLIGANSDVSGPIENGIAPACRALVAPIEMAKDLGVSKYVLSRLFSKTFHRNFNQYLNDARLNYACHRLENTSDSITNICLDSGFESQRTFNRVFKERYKISPSDYRNTCVKDMLS